jgi:hypothetical protein
MMNRNMVKRDVVKPRSIAPLLFKEGWHASAEVVAP